MRVQQNFEGFMHAVAKSRGLVDRVGWWVAWVTWVSMWVY